VHGGFDRKALVELRLLRSLWVRQGEHRGEHNHEHNHGLWLPQNVHAANNEWWSETQGASRTSTGLLRAPPPPLPSLWFLGPPVDFRLKTMMDEKKLLHINPRRFAQGLSAALCHCHTRKILLGKQALSISSIYLTAKGGEFTPVIVDLSGATHVR
jgi:hypothetical protein